MARILIGWEFGANRGHAVRMAQLARLLREGGHEIHFAVQQVDAFRPGEAAGAAVWQAPITPRLLTTAPRSTIGQPTGMGDILARLGMDDAGIVEAMVAAWRQILLAVRPELVVAEFAPFLLLAARGEAPGLAVGTGFQTPPPEMADFPQLVDGEAAAQEAATLAAVNAGLAAAGAAPLRALPQVFAADRVVTETFAEIDPYNAHRQGPLAYPAPAMPERAAGGGEEVFVYAPDTLPAQSKLWEGLAAAGVPVRVHVPRARPRLRDRLAQLGFAFEPEPLPIAAIAERSRLLVSHGGHGFVCAGLAAGLPHIVCYLDLEKLFHGRALAGLGLGGHVAMAGIRPDAFGPSLKRIHADDAMAARARAAAPGFRERSSPSLEEMVEAALAELL